RLHRASEWTNPIDRVRDGGEGGGADARFEGGGAGERGSGGWRFVLALSLSHSLTQLFDHCRPQKFAEIAHELRKVPSFFDQLLDPVEHPGGLAFKKRRGKSHKELIRQKAEEHLHLFGR